MIVRIPGEGQYRLAADDGALGRLDEDVLAAVESGEEDRFRSALGALVGYVRSNGELVGEDELLASDLILPPADLSLAEARTDFSGDGLIPD